MQNSKILEYCKDKDTDNKYRWCVMVDKTKFKLYIPKLRVPKPIPSRVRVVIYLPGDELPELSSVKYNDAACSPEQLQSPIVAKMRYISPHTDTIRYDPIGNSKEWETGSPYIPTSLLPAEIPAELTISVEWLSD